MDINLQIPLLKYWSQAIIFNMANSCYPERTALLPIRAKLDRHLLYLAASIQGIPFVTEIYRIVL